MSRAIVCPCQHSDGDGAAAKGNVDLATSSAKLEVFGRDDRDNLHVAIGADMDGDGKRELILAGPSADLPGDTRDSAGEIYSIEQ